MSKMADHAGERSCGGGGGHGEWGTGERARPEGLGRVGARPGPRRRHRGLRRRRPVPEPWGPSRLPGRGPPSIPPTRSHASRAGLQIQGSAPRPAQPTSLISDCPHPEGGLPQVLSAPQDGGGRETPCRLCPEGQFPRHTRRP